MHTAPHNVFSDNNVIKLYISPSFSKEDFKRFSSTSNFYSNNCGINAFFGISFIILEADHENHHRRRICSNDLLCRW